jgi:hypothetical protein
MDGASKSAGAASPFVLPAPGQGTPFEAPPRAGLPLHPRHPKEGLGAADTNPRAWSAQRIHKAPLLSKGSRRDALRDYGVRKGALTEQLAKHLGRHLTNMGRR